MAKIVGPGNTFVACAKKEVFGDVGIDMVAGPSEVSIVADKTADPDLVAADLIAQAEHDIYAQSILITDNKNLIRLVNLSLKKQLKQLVKMAEITNEGYDIILQEFVKDSYGKDLRVLVVNGKVAGCMMRQSTDDDFRANITRGGEGIPYQITEDIEWLGGESARLLGLDIAGAGGSYMATPRDERRFFTNYGAKSRA